jgi:hypothetical protein
MSRIVILDSGLCFGLTKNLSDVLYVNMSSHALEGYERFVGYGCRDERVKVGSIYEVDLREAECILVPDNSISYYIEVIEGLDLRENAIYPNMDAANLEFDKGYMQEILEEYDIKTVKRKVCHGYSELVRACEELNWRCVIKIDKFETRGVLESSVILSMNDFIKWADKLSRLFGAVAGVLTFVVSEYYEEGSFTEYGLDVLVENGRVKKPYLVGKENGLGYLSEVTDRSLKDIVGKFEEVFSMFGYNCGASIELFVFQDGSYAITDVNMRFGMPFSLMYPVIISNWEELLCGWNDGVMPEFKARFVGAKIETAEEVFEDVTEYMNKENFVPTRVMCVDGRYYYVPVFGAEDYDVAGLSVGYGRTVRDVIDMVGGDDKWVKGMVDEK